MDVAQVHSSEDDCSDEEDPQLRPAVHAESRDDEEDPESRDIGMAAQQLAELERENQQLHNELGDESPDEQRLERTRSDSRRHKSGEIYTKYIDDEEATMLINVTETQRKSIKGMLGNPTADCFDDLQALAVKDMQKDLLPRFLRSKQFHAWIDSTVAPLEDEAAAAEKVAAAEATAAAPGAAGCCVLL